MSRTDSTGDFTTTDNFTEGVVQPNPVISLKTALKQVLSVSFPIFASNTLSTARSIASNIFISRYSDDALAASSLISSTQLIMQNIPIAGIFAVGIVSNIVKGEAIQNNAAPVAVNNVMQQGLKVVAILAVPSLIIGALSEPILLGLGQEPELAAIAGGYLRIFTFSIPGELFLRNLQESVISDTPFSVLIFMMVSAPAKVALGYGLMYGFGAVPGFGPRGFALANVILTYATLIAYGGFVLIVPKFRPYQLFRSNHLRDNTYFWQIMKIGLPIALTSFSELSAAWGQSILMGLEGRISLAASEITSQIAFFCVLPVLSFSHVSGILIGQYAAQNQFGNAAQIGLTTLRLLIPLQIIFWVLQLAIPDQLGSIFLRPSVPNRQAILSLSRVLFVIQGGALVLDTVRNVSAANLSGFRDTKFTMLCSLMLMLVLGCGAGALMGLGLGLDGPGIYLGSTIAITFATILLSSRWFSESEDKHCAEIHAGKQERKSCPTRYLSGIWKLPQSFFCGIKSVFDQTEYDGLLPSPTLSAKQSISPPQ